MKKLLILLAALSLVACSSNAPKEETVEPTPVVTETVVVEEVVVVEETPTIEETVIEESIVEEVPVVEETPTMESTTYTVLDGDNLFRIGLKYNMSWENIAKENNISNPDVITAGEELTIPIK